VNRIIITNPITNKCLIGLRLGSYDLSFKNYLSRVDEGVN